MTDVNTETIRNQERAYFAAMNSGKGFISFFDELFFCPAVTERYIIKGGPGTGKSSFMRRVALHAARDGHGVEYYYCSSDTSSLDGVVIDGSVAIFDGTAPHSYDAALPGALDTIIDLGAFWNSDALREKTDEIRALGAQKNAAYARAYGYLGAALELSRTAEGLISRCVMKDKLMGAVRRCAERQEKSGTRGRLRPCQVSARGTTGAAELSTLFNASKYRYAVADYYGSAYSFLGALVHEALARGSEAWVSRDTVDPQRISQALFPYTGELYYVCERANDARQAEENGEGRVINMRRFVDSSALSLVRREARAAAGAYGTLTELACAALAEAGRAHAALEDIYVPTMDFSAEQGFCDDFIERLHIR